MPSPRASIRYLWAQASIILSCSFNFKDLLVTGGYPYSSDDLTARQEQILDKLRGEMSLLLNDDIVPSELKQSSFGKLFLRNMEGHQFAAAIHKKLQKAPEESFHRPELTDYSLLSSLMTGLCSMLPQNYWNVEWCHREDVSQFHIEIVSGRPERSPMYSLGTYRSSSVIRERGESHNKSARIIKIVDHFTSGQHCDETGMGRSSEVHIQCCRGLHVNAANIDTVNTVKNSRVDGTDGVEPTSPEAATLKAISEPAVCSYQLIVCSPLLCDDVPEEYYDGSHGEGGEGGSAIDSARDARNKRVRGMQGHLANQTLSQVMLSLINKCMYRKEEWWIYEVCFGSGVRQFRMEEVTPEVVQGQAQVPLKDAPRTEALVAEFFLGRFPVPLPTDNEALEAGYYNRSALGGKDPLTTSSPSSPRTDDPSGHMTVLDMGLGLPAPVLLGRNSRNIRSIQLDFTEGTACDILEATNRSSTVEIFCGQRDGILDIVEDRTCHYKIRVHAVAACSSPLLAPIERKVVRIDFTSVDDSVDDVEVGTETPDL